MSRARFGLVFALLGTLALWGCSQHPSGSPVSAAKTNRLQEEVHSLTTQRDQLRQDLQAVQQEKDRLDGEMAKLRLVVKERDELKQTLSQRTSERDQTMTQLDNVRKGMKSLIEEVEASLPILTPPVTAVTTPAGNAS